jgi:endonuclease YncB( thermonuclease family)
MGGLPCMNGKASSRRGNDDATMALRCAPSSPDTLSCCRVSEYRGEVVRVVDGDTFEVLHNQCPECIRLSGIDCPEKGQAYGTRAKQATSAMVFGKEVTLQTHGLDKYKRTLADVLLPERQSLAGQRRLALSMRRAIQN